MINIISPLKTIVSNKNFSKPAFLGKKENDFNAEAEAKALLESFLYGDKKDTFEKTSLKKDCVEVSKETLDQAKEIVMRSILTDNPKESLVLVQDDKIVYQQDGSETGIGLSADVQKALLRNSSSKIGIIHSHPKNKSGVTPPVSLGDCMSLLQAGCLGSCYAINDKGEYSLLRKPNGYKDSFYIIKCQIAAFEFYRVFAQVFTGEEKEEYNKALLEYKEKYQTSDDAEEIQTAYLKLLTYLNKVMDCPDIDKIIHNIWLELAPRLGLEYETNFSGI